MFYLVELVQDGTKPDGAPTFRDVPLPDYGPYDTGVEAGRVAKDLTTHRVNRVQPRRIAQVGDWRAIAAEVAGKLEPLPDGWDLAPIPDHFAHRSKSRKDLIAYIANEVHGAIGRVTELRPGRYIQQFYPDVPDERRRALAALLDPMGHGFKIADDEDTIEWVYENGPDSCMTTAYQHRHKNGDFHSNIHPVRVYAAGDLAVAYRVNEDGDAVTERALIWPEKRIFSRIYGDASGRLLNALEDEGYVKGFGKDWDGARLKRVPQYNYDEEEWAFVCPYFDRGHEAGSGCRSVIDDGKFLRVVHEYVRGWMETDAIRGLQTAVFKAGCEPDEESDEDAGTNSDEEQREAA
jgi:hypothetical protein